MTSIKRIVPLFDRVLIQRVKAAERTSSGIFIPEKAQEVLNIGEVMEIGPGIAGKDGKVIPISVKKGDKVLLPSFGGTSIKVSEEEYQLFRDSELLAKVEIK